MFDMTSLKPYLRQDEPPHRHFDPYNFGRHDLGDVVDRYPHFLETPSTYELVLRKLENIYFKKMRQDKARALNKLRRKKKREGVLGQLYDQVHKNCKEIFALRIPGTVTEIKNPYKVKERRLLEDGTVEWIHSGKASEYVEFPALHQKRGILHIARHKRILIADEMGTGKTAQAVLAKLYLEHKLGRKLKTLIICPNSVKELWIEKIDEYCKNITRKDVVVLAGHRDKEAALKHAKEEIDFVITNYALLSRFPGQGQFNLVDELTKMAFDYVIVDEVHNAKNMDANRAISVSRITKNVEYLVLLSGTPIPNRLKDMGMTMHILDPQRFPNPIAFNRLYSKNPRILRDLLLSGRMLRVRANEVIQLPSLKSRKITVNPTSHQREAYIRVFLDEKLNSYSKLAKLRRILIDPNIIPAYLDVEKAQSGKLKELDRIINEKATQGEKTVVYTNFKYRVTDMLARRYAKYGVCVIDGDVPARTRMDDDSDREKIRKEFQTGDKRVLIATIGTLCEGVDLTAARTVIFLDPPFTSTAMDQSTSRVHRLGQSRPVEVYNLIASDGEIADITRHPETGQSGTIDEAMYDLVEKKERIIDHVIDGARLSKDELRLLEKNSDASQLLKSIAYAISPQ
jgi:SNF2 family DNA or RNA helicase